MVQSVLLGLSTVRTPASSFYGFTHHSHVETLCFNHCRWFDLLLSSEDPHIMTSTSPPIITSVSYLFIAVCLWPLCTPAETGVSVQVCVWMCFKAKSNDKWRCFFFPFATIDKQDLTWNESVLTWWRSFGVKLQVRLYLCNNTIFMLPFTLSLIKWKNKRNVKRDRRFDKWASCFHGDNNIQHITSANIYAGMYEFIKLLLKKT